MFMRRSLFIAIAGVAAVLAACKGGKSDAGESFPADFNALPDTARVAYVMKTQRLILWRVSYAVRLPDKSRVPA